MLFKQKDLEQIKKGEINLAFRQWKAPRVITNSLHNTSIGQIQILHIEPVSKSRITEDDAIKAGFPTKNDLLGNFPDKIDHNIYRIEVVYKGEGPRIALREDDKINGEELEQIKVKLERLDKYSRKGDWTLKTMQIINENPQVRSADLFKIIGLDQKAFKLNVRKLKNLGLTISHGVGYSLSARGRKVFEYITNKD